MPDRRYAERPTPALRYDANRKQRGIDWERISGGRLSNPIDPAADSPALDEPVRRRRKK